MQNAQEAATGTRANEAPTGHTSRKVCSLPKVATVHLSGLPCITFALARHILSSWPIDHMSDDQLYGFSCRGKQPCQAEKNHRMHLQRRLAYFWTQVIWGACMRVQQHYPPHGATS